MTRGKKVTKVAAHPVSPLAPKSFPKLPPLAGVRLSTVAAGVRYHQRTDVLLALFAPGTRVAGVFTTSKTASAPVLWCRDKLKGADARVLVVNSGNANAFTGKAGQEGVRVIAKAAAAVASRTPARGGNLGKVFGAKGDMGWAAVFVTFLPLVMVP